MKTVVELDDPAARRSDGRTPFYRVVLPGRWRRDRAIALAEEYLYESVERGRVPRWQRPQGPRSVSVVREEEQAE